METGICFASWMLFVVSLMAIIISYLDGIDKNKKHRFVSYAFAALVVTIIVAGFTTGDLIEKNNLCVPTTEAR